MIKCKLDGFNKLIEKTGVSILFTGEEGWMSIDKDEKTLKDIFSKGQFNEDLPPEKCFHFYGAENTLDNLSTGCRKRNHFV